MKRIEPTMPSEKTLHKISLATGDFEQMSRVPTTVHSVVESDSEKISKEPTDNSNKASTLFKLSQLSMKYSDEEKDIERILYKFYCSLRDQGIELDQKSKFLLKKFSARAFVLSDFHEEVISIIKTHEANKSSQSVEDQDLELDENYYLLNQLSPLAYKAA